ARFIRSLSAPPRDGRIACSSAAQQGLRLFREVGCAICHTEQFATVPVATDINGGTLRVPAALAGKTFTPFSDFLLHDVGTGDGIVQAGGQTTANKFRTAPLWGLRVKSRLMHDGLSFTRHEAILRHGGQAADVVRRYKALNIKQQQQLLTFLRSL